MSKLQRHQEALQKLMVFNNYCKSIIYISPEDNHFWMITVEHLYNRKKRLEQLKFELHDLLDNHPVDYFQGQLWMDVYIQTYKSPKKHNLKDFGFTNLEHE
ncbi:hypothetical protein [Streptococcus dysgalactiae]|uniref:hypothetical protein n=1 Tax=Streptococcus dysgalactiae TaxID=1334 RepID=UPI003FD8D2B9